MLPNTSEMGEKEIFYVSRIYCFKPSPLFLLFQLPVKDHNTAKIF